MLSPSGKLCSASPILTIIPVFNNVFDVLTFFILVLNFFWTSTSHAIIPITPSKIPSIIKGIPDISSASGTRSKHTIDIINPDASDKMKLKNLLLVVLKVTPIIPPNVVPNVPKNNPIKVVFNKYPKIKISLLK